MLPARTRALFLVLVSLLATVPAVGLVVTAGGANVGQGVTVHNGSIDPGESAVFGQVLYGPGGDSTPAPPCRTG
ncbi:hypothetical protein [Streptomyces sp. NRRL S-37]|uniref:hypothetical protein n=1 Tax=Streptomyces sp. NRRL S-37 TaxID=1463903 RepID=UPI0004C72031|nr:hypothetical protein [Streptomyces sp. NRRL S-37]